MYKKSIFTLVILAMGFQLNAQEKTEDTRDMAIFGVKAGGNISNVYDASGDAFVANPKLGFAGGAFLSLPLSTTLGFQPEVLFSQKGFKATGQLLGSGYIITRTSNFLDIPLLFALKPSKYLTVLVGPQYSYLMKQTDVIANGPNSYMQEQAFKNDNIHKNTLCFTGGLDIHQDQMIFSLRAGWDVQKNNGDGTSSTPRYKNVWYQATIGFRIN